MKFSLIFSLCFVALSAFAQLPWTIRVGSSPNNEDGDSFKVCLEKINSNMVYLLNNSGGGGGGPATNINGNALVSGTVNSNKLDAATVAMFGFVANPFAVNAFSANSATISNAVGNAAGFTNMNFFSLHFTTNVVTTNWILGSLDFTNGGVRYSVPFGTNQ